MKVTLSNGVTYTATRDGVTPFDVVASEVEAAMESGELVGLQVDEFVGLTGNWDLPEADVAAFSAFAAAARDVGLTVTDTDVDLPDPEPRG